MALKVGIVRDDRFLLHQPGLMRPERPERLTSIYAMLDKEFGDGIPRVQAELGSLEHLELVHTPNYIRKVLRTAERKLTYLAADTPVSSQSYLAASLAVGGCIKGLQALLSGRRDACFALIRPPGHHALPDSAGGFCVFNNVGITARYAAKRHGLERILIVDWDIHHGNGIQELFYGEKEVLYFSSHVMGWYPGTGDWDETGEGAGLGYTINLPLPRDMGDSDVAALYASILPAVIRSYKPELILVAAGFDGHYLDPLGKAQWTEKCYRDLAQLLVDVRETADNPLLLLALEGGYHVTALAACVKQVLEVLVTGSPRGQAPVVMSEKAAELLAKLRSIHSKYGVW